jgi:hypothetical protein
VLLDPLRPFMVTSDRQGVLRVSNYRSGTCINRFHAGTGASIGGASTAYSRALAAAAGAAPPMAVRSVFQVSAVSFVSCGQMDVDRLCQRWAGWAAGWAAEPK